MRRPASIFVGLALAIAALPAPALAHPPERSADTQTTVECLDLASDAGTAAFIINVSETYGAWAQVGFWAPESIPFEDPPTWFGSTDQVVVAADGSSLSATVDMHEFSEEMSDGVLIGQASVMTSLAPDGPPETFRDTGRGSNVRFVFEGTSQPLVVSGSLDLPEGIDYELAGCTGSTSTVTAFVTNPDAQVMRAAHLELSCSWETEGAQVMLFAIADDFGASTELFVTDATGMYAGFGEATLTSASYAAALDLIAIGGEGEQAIAAIGGDIQGTARASATLSPSGQRDQERFSFQDTKVHLQRDVLTVDGTLDVSLPAGDASYAMDATSCSAADTRVKQITTSPQGPKVRPLANDLPADAAPIAVGDTVSVATGGTALDPEAPCRVEDGETGEPVELPFGHTAWWSFEGTGAQVTIDTVGSDFDTALGVYSASLDPLGCVDDVDSLQARITVDTVVGVTYLVQAGGFAADSGVLELRLD